MRVLNQFYLIVLFLFTVCGLMACDNGRQSNSNFGSIRLNIQSLDNTGRSTDSSANLEKGTIDCSAMEIDSVRAKVLSESGTDVLAQGGPWPCDKHQGNITEIPPGPNLMVEVFAEDTDNTVKYYGKTMGVHILNGYTTPVEVTLELVSRTPVISMVQDIHQDAGSSFPHKLKPFNNQLFFVAYQPDTNFELFITDGTTEGTQLVKDINSLTVSTPYSNEIPEPFDLTEYNGQLYFFADDGTNGPGLWQTDGSPNNTLPVASPQNKGFSNPGQMVVLNNIIFFSADHSDFGRELWKSDGTQSGTEIAHDIFEGEEGSNPHELTIMDNWLYFVADDGEHGFEIWRSNGTTAEIVRDICEEPDPDQPNKTRGSHASELTVVNKRLFFRAVDSDDNEEIWIVMGNDNSAGAMMVTELNEQAGKSSCLARYLTNINNTYLAFSAFQQGAGDTTSLFGIELWLYDWSHDVSPLRVTDINPGSAHSHPSNFVAMNDVLYFTASDSQNQEHLWAYPLDRTATAVCLTKGMIDPAPRHLTVFDGILYFTVFQTTFGRELWSYDGTDTERVNDICTGTCSSSPSDFTVLDNQLFFSAYSDENGKELFQLRHHYGQ